MRRSIDFLRAYPRTPADKPTRRRLDGSGATVAAALYAALTAIADSARWTTAKPDEWVAYACLNAIGLGVIPVVLGLAGLVPGRGEARSRELRMFRCVGVGGIVAFGLYTLLSPEHGEEERQLELEYSG